MARAVVAVVSDQLPPSAALERDSVWLGRIPACLPVLVPRVWAVVAVAAIGAMDKGRALLARWELEQQDPNSPRPPPPARRVDVASSRAVLAFWGFLQNFVRVQEEASTWGAGVPPTHPFLRRVGGRLEVGMG